ncbi:MAG: hypothetical protein ACD_37C00288G0002 [uncultured bacterium]|nr:MAG: hypothetical protein ACD_37C00288G0002 [uncultured bacterium]
MIMNRKYYCPKCKSEITKTPTSSYKEGGKIWHIPHFGRAVCTNCGWKSGPYGYGLVKDKETTAYTG